MYDAGLVELERTMSPLFVTGSKGGPLVKCFAHAAPRFLVAASIYEGLSVMRRAMLVFSFASDVEFLWPRRVGGFRRWKIHPFCAKRGFGKAGWHGSRVGNQGFDCF
mmetsp:Transcript_40947/g.67179  ORF Transcript_40947/g.67179 Transcript_40947/m.67179 type:complete len:107 (+) Transcript_40947:718-1038(+)